MDIYSSSFNYPRLSSSSTAQHRPHNSNDFAADLALPLDSSFSSPHILQLTSPRDAQLLPGDIPSDTLQKVVLDAMQTHPCHITYTHNDPPSKGFNLHLSGNYLQVMTARGMIMREASIQFRTTIKVPRNDILDHTTSSPTLKADIRGRLDEIAEQANTNISVINPANSMSASNGATSHATNRFGLETEKMCDLLLIGTQDCVEVARVRLLVMLDELSGLHSECCEIDHKLHAVIAGRKRSALQSIQEETGTNIYYPSPLHAVFGASFAPSPLAAPVVAGIAPPRHNNNVIWITGEFFGVQRARDMLFQISVNKVRSKSVMSRDAAILPRKLDWMLTDRMDDLKSIMNDNGTFISFPPLASQTSMVTVYGENRVNIQRTIRCVMQLACQFYVASFWLLPTHFNVLMPPTSINIAQMPAILKSLALQSGAEVVFKSNCFEVHGLAAEVRLAIQLITELDLVKGYHHEIRFQLELANEQRDFISGKKNGKINKIMQAANVKIKFETFNDHNFLIDISGNDLSTLSGLAMLHEELPAELSFHVPESYHKRIIGVGGKSIQRIMKKYGVYVKFSNAEELANLGGYMDVDDNVVARTPAKNAMNLESLKAAVMELVNPKDKDFVVETLVVPRKYHRSLLGEKSIFIHDIESKTNSRIRFPDKETGSEIVTIFGPESQVHITAAMLLDHIPFEAQMPVPYSFELAHFCNSSEFVNFIDKIKREFQVTITPSIITVSAPAPEGSPRPQRRVSWRECAFILGCQRSNSDSLSTVREMLEQALIEGNVQVYPPPNSHKRADSFAEAFPHFDSKLLSSATSPDPSDLPRSISGVTDRGLLARASSDNVKALFNNMPSMGYLYAPSEQEPEDSVSSPSSAFPAGMLDDYCMPLPIISTSTGLQVERSRGAEAFKRGSDSLIEKKLKDSIAKPRSLTNRAQSLDISLELQRMAEKAQASSRLLPPDSPTNSIYGPLDDLSPTMTVPSFPSVYAPPASIVAPPSRMSSLGRTARPPNLDSMDEMAQVVASLHL